jgi:hypothetical protein
MADEAWRVVVAEAAARSRESGLEQGQGIVEFIAACDAQGLEGVARALAADAETREEFSLSILDGLARLAERPDAPIEPLLVRERERARERARARARAHCSESARSGCWTRSATGDASS